MIGVSTWLPPCRKEHARRCRAPMRVFDASLERRRPTAGTSRHTRMTTASQGRRFEADGSLAWLAALVYLATHGFGRASFDFEPSVLSAIAALKNGSDA